MNMLFGNSVDSEGITIMNDNVLKLIVAALDLAKALVWPALLIWFVLRFRTDIAALVGRIGSMKVGSVEWVFQKVEQIQAELQKTNLVVGGLSENPNNPKALEAAKTLMRPDGALVIAWARDHGADNAWDMGPKNWERCLFDLGHPGGIRHELIMEGGKLKYQ
jgi:hypothetical protein